jgi:flavin reductase (DIM6/NTAB) family NADH-FMN oxidoreductase RutF
MRQLTEFFLIDFPLTEVYLAMTLPLTKSIVPDDLESRAVHQLLLSIVVPRPIAWVSTVSKDGVLNLAPYSFFNGVNGSPPVVMISVGTPRSGRIKDTYTNARDTREMVIHMVDESLGEVMNLTSGEYGPEVDEFALADVAYVPSMEVKPPRVVLAPVAMECKVGQIIPVEGTRSHLIIGHVLRFHIREGLLRPEGLVDGEKMRPIARLGGPEYVTFGEVFKMNRP